MSRHRIVDDSIEARAERRVHRKMAFLLHAFIFVVVNGGLYLLNSITGEPRWSHFPLFGWGLGLAIHGVVTLLSLQGEGLRRGMVAREIETLRRSEPW
jgi:hypothetical protein